MRCLQVPGRHSEWSVTREVRDLSQAVVRVHGGGRGPQDTASWVVLIGGSKTRREISFLYIGERRFGFGQVVRPGRGIPDLDSSGGAYDDQVFF